MENASKAIIMAGGILIGVILLSVLVLVFNPIGRVYEEQGISLSVEQLEKYNRQFNTFDKSLYGSELLSLKNLLEDYNYRVLQDADQKYREENEITVIVKIYNYTAEELVDKHGVVKRTNYKKRRFEGRVYFS